MSLATDVLIVGAGPAGLALACALADDGRRITVVEQQSADALAAPLEDGREIALTHRGRSVLRRLGLWDRLPAGEIASLREARVADGDRASLLHFRPADAGGGTGTADGPLGWLVPNHRLREAAWHGAADRPGVTVIPGARVTGLRLDDDAARLGLDDGRTLSAALVVAADSRFSTVRRMAGIGARMRDFGRTVVTGRIAHDRPHLGIAWECFRHGHTLALLPMAGDRSSAVITVRSDEAPAWQDLDDAGFAARVEAAAGGLVTGVRAEGPRHAYPLVGVYAHRFVARRFALVGDAAVGMHPVTAHGFNFGLYGIEVLAGALRRHGFARAEGLTAALRDYESEHRRTTAPVYLGTNVVVGLFTDDRPLARLARPAVLAIAGRAPVVGGLVRRAIARQLTGGGRLTNAT